MAEQTKEATPTPPSPANGRGSREAQASDRPRRAVKSGTLAVIAALLGGVIFVCLNLISAQELRSVRADFTQQHLYSLSKGTRALLADMKEPVRFRLFMSAQLTKQAPQLAAFANRVRSLLDAYVAAANGEIVLETIDPRPFSEDEDRAVAFGIDSFPGSGGERLFFGLAATDSTTGSANIAVFTPDREPFLEYDLTRLIAQLSHRGKPTVALIDGLGISGNPMLRMPEQQVLVAMKQFFDVKPVAGDVDKLPEGTRVLMVVHPQNLTQRTLYTIDQWVLAGNAAMIFVDPYAENQLGPPGGEPPENTSSTLEPLFTAWGVKFDVAHAVGDAAYALQSERNVGGRPVVAENLPWLALRADALSHDEAILSQLSAIVMTTAGSFETNKDGATLRPLLRASPRAVMLDPKIAADRSADPRRLMVGATRYAKPPILAARLSGTLDSAFPDGPPKAANQDPAAPSRDENTIKRSEKPINVILVGDADMLMDRNWIQQQSLFGHAMAQAFANNGDFVINAIEEMAGGAALSDLRGRGISWRPFELIQRMEADADSQYRAKEQELMQQLNETQEKLAQLPKAAEGADALTPEQLKAVEGFRTQLLGIRSQLRDVQFALRRDVDNLKSLITALNVGAVPLVVAIIALGLALRRPRARLPVKKTGEAA
jgi:ABC-type uncharacterized transport system involved in gliding motility auxiliary subunit